MIRPTFVLSIREIVCGLAPGRVCCSMFLSRFVVVDFSGCDWSRVVGTGVLTEFIGMSWMGAAGVGGTGGGGAVEAVPARTSWFSACCGVSLGFLAAFDLLLSNEFGSSSSSSVITSMLLLFLLLRLF